MLQPLSRDFFEPSASVVAPRLLGHWLVRKTPEGLCGGPIVETEAYVVDDPACHAFVGRTKRNEVMWGPPGFAYVYFIYGNHSCVNAVCGPEQVAEAVLVRALEARLGIEIMQRQRPRPDPIELTNGPGKLCAALGITRELNGTDLCSRGSGLVIAENPDLGKTLAELGPMLVTERVGITKAAHLPLRFYLAGSPYVSKRAAHDKSPRHRTRRGGTTLSP